jgi:glycosyltransferase involved in cell wall biosynthesis
MVAIHLRVIITRSNPVAPDPRVEKLAHSLMESNHDVRIVCWDRTGEWQTHAARNDLSILRLHVPAQFGKGMQNLPHLLRWEFRLLRWLYRNQASFDVIHACDFDTILPAMIVGKLFHKKIVYDIFDFYADHLRATPEAVRRWIGLVDVWVVSHVDALILADESRREQIRGGNPKRVEIVYNTPMDMQVEAGSFAKPENSKLHLAFVGLLQIERGLLELFEVLARHPDWSLDLAGFGGDEGILLPKASALPNVRCHDRVPYGVAIKIMSGADILIATYDPAIPNHRYASANKLFEAMMLAKPIIVADGTNMDRIVTQYHCGLSVKYGDVHALEHALMNIAQDERLRRKLGDAGRHAYETQFHWDIMDRRLSKLYTFLSGDTAGL